MDSMDLFAALSGSTHSGSAWIHNVLVPLRQLVGYHFPVHISVTNKNISSENIVELYFHIPPKVKVMGALDSIVDNALACHLCDPGSNPGEGMWQGSGRPSPGSPVSSTTFDHITPTSAPSRMHI